MSCSNCHGVHAVLKYRRGDRVKALSMMPHILRSNPFGDIKPDRTGDVGTVYRTESWERIQETAYLVEFDGGHLAPFDECQLELVRPKRMCS